MNLNTIKFLVIIIISSSACSKKIILKESKEITQVSESNNLPNDIEEFQKELEAEYANPKKSPLNESQIIKFKENDGHDFYNIDLQYQVKAHLNRNVNVKDIKFKTTSKKIKVFDLYGVATFKLNGQEYSVNIYQSHYLRTKEEYKNHLFFPFYDLTNNNETYGGGRYVDLIIPQGDKIIIDFNKAYDPFCAYSSNYSCPIPPIENSLEVEIKAGVKYLNDYK